MKIIRRAMLSIVAAAALAAAAVAFAQNWRHDGPGDAPAAHPRSSFMPPIYFGPAYSTAAVYDYLRSPQGAEARRRAEHRRGMVGR
jgi:hypothetical protein